jgi:hypothetical protein
MKCRPEWLYPILLAFGLVVAACADGTEDGPPPSPTGNGQPRSYAMGLSSLPPELTEESYGQTFELAASVGELILIQHTLPWQDMLSGNLSGDTVQTTKRETGLAHEHGLDIFVAIDPTDASTGRSQLADLPPELDGAGFADEDVRRAFVGYAQYVTENYHPKYLALGVEINSYQHQHPKDFEQFVTLYHETYEAVKELAPETLVFPTFQLEELQGLLPVDDPYPTQWHLISRFEPRLDLLAVSSYPGLAYSQAEEIPDVYFVKLASYTDRPIAITGMGYSSGSGTNGTDSEAEEEQKAFLRRALDSAQQLGMPLVVWFVGQDPTFTGGSLFDRLQSIGLRRQDGTAKPAWLAWEAAARLPLESDDP